MQLSDIKKVTCPRCNGEKECACQICKGTPVFTRIICGSCSGSGKELTGINCWDCNEKGIVLCKNCEGRRVVDDGITCLDCRGTGIVDCGKCKGTGKQGIGEECYLCEGNGSYVPPICQCKTGRVTCYECHGSGEVPDPEEFRILTEEQKRQRLIQEAEIEAKRIREEEERKAQLIRKEEEHQRRIEKQEKGKTITFLVFLTIILAGVSYLLYLWIF